MKAVKSTVDDWPVTHPVIRAALMEEEVCPDCGHDLEGCECAFCGARLPEPEIVYLN